jgi:hypothetical protein
MSKHRMIHRESLASKELCPELGEVMDTVIKTVKSIKTRRLRSRYLHNYSRKYGHSISHSCFTAILVGCKKRNVSRVNNLRVGVALFSEPEIPSAYSTFSQRELVLLFHPPRLGDIIFGETLLNKPQRDEQKNLGNLHDLSQ